MPSSSSKASEVEPSALFFRSNFQKITSSGKLGQDLLLCAEDIGDEGGADPHAVSLLAPVGRAWIFVHGHLDLVAPRKRVHDGAVSMDLGEVFLLEMKGREGLGLALRIAGILVLNPGHIDGVDFGHDAFEVVRFVEGDGVLVQEGLDVVLHPEDLGRHVVDGDIFVALQQIGQRTHGAAALEVAHHGDLLAVEAADGSKLALQRIDVEQGLGRVLVGSGAAVQDRHRAFGLVQHPGSLLGKSGLGVPSDDQVHVACEGADGVLGRFALHFGTGACTAAF